MQKINPLDWQPLAQRYATMYRGQAEPDDLFQQAMLGVVKAASTFKGLATFQGWASLHIRSAIQQLIYTDANTKAKRNRLECRLIEVDEDEKHSRYADLLARDYHEQEEMYVSEFIEQLPVEQREKEFFIDILEHGSTVAGKRYMERHDITRAAMGQRRLKLIAIAEKMYEI